MRARGAAVVQPPEGSSTAPPVACRTPEPHAPACTGTAPPAHPDQARTHQHPHCPDTLSRISSPHSTQCSMPPSQSGMNINCTLQRGGGCGCAQRAGAGAPGTAAGPGPSSVLRDPAQAAVSRKDQSSQGDDSAGAAFAPLQSERNAPGVGGREGGFSADSDACDQMDLRLAGPQGARAGVDLLLSSGSCPQ